MHLLLQLNTELNIINLNCNGVQHFSPLLLSTHGQNKSDITEQNSDDTSGTTFHDGKHQYVFSIRDIFLLPYMQIGNPGHRIYRTLLSVPYGAS
jgi:hypothetical protein